MKALRIGLLVNDSWSSKYDRDLVLWAREQADIEISHLVVYPRHGGSRFGRAVDVLRRQGPYALLCRLLFQLIAAVEAWILKHGKSDAIEIARTPPRKRAPPGSWSGGVSFDPTGFGSPTLALPMVGSAQPREGLW